MRILGLIPARDEALTIANAVEALKRCCDQVHVFDHGSVDATGAIATEHGAAVHWVDPVKLPGIRNGRRVFDFWNHIAEYALSRQDEFDWVVWSDADDLLREPDGKLATREGIEREAAAGFDVIRPLTRLFQLTPRDNEDESDYLRRIRYYRTEPKCHSPRAWRIDLTPLPNPTQHMVDPACVELACSHYRHWPEGTRVNNNNWTLDQYPFQTPEQGEAKINGPKCNYTTPRGTRRYSWHIKPNGRVDVVTRYMAKLRYEHRPLEMP